MNDDPRGFIINQGNIMRINNAFVEEVSCFNNSNGTILISYSVPGRNNRNSIQTMRLNLSSRTAVLNNFGQRICICCIQRGSWVNVVFSSRMTKSYPPIANAFLVVVQRNPQRPQPPLPPQRPSSETTGRIILIDFDNRFIITENPKNRNRQTRFLITNATTFTNRFGSPIRFNQLQTGQMARITHANFQTPGIPPQTTAFHVQLI